MREEEEKLFCSFDQSYYLSKTPDPLYWIGFQLTTTNSEQYEVQLLQWPFLVYYFNYLACRKHMFKANLDTHLNLINLI